MKQVERLVAKAQANNNLEPQNLAELHQNSEQPEAQPQNGQQIEKKEEEADSLEREYRNKKELWKLDVI